MIDSTIQFLPQPAYNFFPEQPLLFNALLNSSFPERAHPLQDTAKKTSSLALNSSSFSSQTTNKRRAPETALTKRCTTKRTKKNWTPEEDEKVREGVRKYKKKWTEISKNILPNRDGISIRLRWMNRLNPEILQGRWTPEEDDKLREGVKKHGTKWMKISKNILPSRPGKCIRERWLNHLDPKLNKNPCSKEEKNEILNHIKIMLPTSTNENGGIQWKKITKQWNKSKKEGEFRSETFIKNIFYTKKRCGKLKKTSQAAIQKKESLQVITDSQSPQINLSEKKLSTSSITTDMTAQKRTSLQTSLPFSPQINLPEKNHSLMAMPKKMQSKSELEQLQTITIPQLYYTRLQTLYGNHKPGYISNLHQLTIEPLRSHSPEPEQKFETEPELSDLIPFIAME